MNRIAKLTQEDDGNCRVCESENPVVTIQGAVSCGYCGNQVNLCMPCLERMQNELTEVIISLVESNNNKFNTDACICNTDFLRDNPNGSCPVHPGPTG